MKYNEIIKMENVYVLYLYRISNKQLNNEKYIN